MSIKVFGDANTIKVNNLNIVVEEIDVPIDVPSQLNRRTEAATLKQMLDSAGGFHWGLWERPSVARLPSGELRLFDGDHRRALYRMVFPDSKTMPVKVFSVQSYEQIHDIFVTTNTKSRKSLTKDEIFVHEYKANHPQALKEADALERTMLSVSLGTNEPGSVVGSKGAFNEYVSVPITAFRRVLAQSPIENIRFASETIQRCFPKDRKVRAELLLSMSDIITNAENGRKDFTLAMFSAFIPWMREMAGIKGDQKRFITHMKTTGGNRNSHKSKYSISYGILEEFEHSKYVGNNTKLSKKMYNIYFKDYKRRLKEKIEE
jgi:hypothetical protein